MLPNSYRIYTNTDHAEASSTADRLTRIFLPNDQGRRLVYGAIDTFQTDFHWRNLILFYEYFHGDNGMGIGANHQTGWTGLIPINPGTVHQVRVSSFSLLPLS